MIPEATGRWRHISRDIQIAIACKIIALQVNGRFHLSGMSTWHFLWTLNSTEEKEKNLVNKTKW